LWQLQWGKDYQFLVDRSLERGELTKSLQDQPTLLPELVLIWEAFAMTTTSRSYGKRYGREGREYLVAEAIHLSEIAAYCDLIGIFCFDTRKQIARLVQVMDDAYRTYVNPKVK